MQVETYEVESNKTPHMNILIASCFIAGIPHRSPDLTVVLEQDELQIIPEPENPHDEKAIKVIHNDVHLGYIPREATDAIHEALAHDLSISAIVVEKFTTKWKEVKIHVRADLDSIQR